MARMAMAAIAVRRAIRAIAATTVVVLLPHPATVVVLLPHPATVVVLQAMADAVAAPTGAVALGVRTEVVAAVPRVVVAVADIHQAAVAAIRPVAVVVTRPVAAVVTRPAVVAAIPADITKLMGRRDQKRLSSVVGLL